jgi:hypothetical protein
MHPGDDSALPLRGDRTRLRADACRILKCR